MPSALAAATAIAAASKIDAVTKRRSFLGIRAIPAYPLCPAGYADSPADASLDAGEAPWVLRAVGPDHVGHGVDQREVGERLREVAEVPAGAGVDLLGVEL